MNGAIRNKRIGIAVSASLGAHLMLGAALLWLIGKNLQPAVSERLIVLSFSATQRDDAETFDAASDAPTARQSDIAPAEAADQAGLKNRQAARSEPLPGQSEISTTQPAVNPQEQPPARQSTPETAPTPELVVEQTTTQATASVVETAAATPPVVIATDSQRAVIVPQRKAVQTQPTGIALSAIQEKMLSKRIKKWTENLHKYAAQDKPLRWVHKGQSYQAQISRFPARGDTDLEKAVVEVITEQDGEILRTEMQMKMLAFSHFAQFVHRWDPRVQVHDDTLDGRFHSNSKITLGWDRDVQPRFLGKVTTASREVRYANTRGYRNREDIFAGGIETGVKVIPMAREYLPPTLSVTRAESDTNNNAAPNEVAGNSRKVGSGRLPENVATELRFSNDTSLRFQPDGSLVWEDMTTGQVKQQIMSEAVTYLLGAAGKTLFVSGQVAGEVLVYSPTRIVIADDLTYAQTGVHTGDQPGDGPFLGLVSGKDVEIAEPEITGPGPLYVHAAIYARGRFRVRDYRVREQSQLYIYGSLTAGSLSATEPRFATHIEFDKRLEEKRPPGYPMTRRFELEHWDGEWKRAARSAAAE